MAFTEEQLAYLRTVLGSTVNEDTNPDVVDDLETRFSRLQDVKLVAVEVLRQRIADIADVANNPLQYAISGEYSQDASGNLAYLQRLLADVEQDAGVPGGSTLVGVPPADDRWRPFCGYNPHPDSGQYTCYPYGR